ncbi:hypothetical protein [Paraconexibacter sp. AEG42_29]
MRSLLGILVACALLLAACGSSAGAPAASAAQTRAAETRAVTGGGHPRLLIRKQDVPRLRSWAKASNPMWSKGIVPLARRATLDMDRRRVPNKDAGGYSYEQYPTELYSELFAFLSVVHPSAKSRAGYGRRARKLMMSLVVKALPGAKTDAPFRDPMFSVGDRSRYFGESFGLTVDWAYQYFTKADRKKIRTLYLRWAKEQYKGYPLTQISGAKPTPFGPLNNPALLADRHNVRYSLNNYYLGHARNLGLMAMALDPKDDPRGLLRSQIKRVSGSWLYLMDHALRTEFPGGLSPEGFEYGPDATGRLAQLLVAMRTAGPSGDQSPVTKIAGNPYWTNSVPAYLSSLPPVPIPSTPDRPDLGQVWQAASYGDEEQYWALDPITLYGPLGLEAAERGDTATLNATRWIATNVPPGGKAALHDRVGNTDQFFGSILYFLLFDPAAPEATDPRPGLDKRWFAPTLNRTLARTCWCDEGRLFSHKLSFNEIDHQTADGNTFALFRKGEWLTKPRTGYESYLTDFTNSVTIENDKPFHADGEYEREIWKNGDQWILTAGEPTLVARSFGQGFVALTGDATNLYNSKNEEVADVAHASRSVVWLEPDHVITYDRVTSKTAGRFKRYWLQFPTAPSIDGRQARVTTPQGQQVFVSTLLPEDAVLSGSRNPPELGAPAVGEPMKFRLKVEAPGGPQDVRFLNVVQGADGGASADPVLRVTSSAGASYDGAVVGGTAVLFPVAMTGGGTTTVALPDGVRRILVTGLTPGGAYTAQYDGATLTVTDGGAQAADEGGVLVVTP